MRLQLKDSTACTAQFKSGRPLRYICLSCEGECGMDEEDATARNFMQAAIAIQNVFVEMPSSFGVL